MTREQILENLVQAAKDYAKSLWRCGMYDKETPATEDDMANAFQAGAKWMAQQLLSKKSK